MPSKTKRLRRIVEVAPAVIADSCIMRQRNHCIAATAIGIAVCNRFGIEALPASVEVGAFNAPMIAWLQSGLGIEDRPDEAWGVGVRNEATNTDGWDGHLIVELPGFGFMDLNSGQMSRPLKHLFVCDGVFVPSELNCLEEFVFRPHGEFVHEDGSRVKAAIMTYRRSSPGTVSEAWKASPDWLRGTTELGDVVDLIVSLV
jgi:hypothetical protein